jgi:hypothetical protein
VDRPIEGVIKADDDASLRVEVEEYVITCEVEKRLESFLDAYNNYEGANGVWVSGFFGSGKSHLLKILAMLMENREIEGSRVLDLFLPKCGDNEILRGELKRAVAIPSQSILFNIDQKADVISKNQIDALLAVFVKVFDESCGYYGKQAYIAQFERELDQDNLFRKFKDVFKDLSSQEWEWGRMRSKRVASLIDEAYQAVTGQQASGILDKYRSDYRLSIEDFAEQINEYIQRQGTDFRLNFFVDEVGQYVAENVKLMTNLQTIAESFATKSRGRAWIIVTAQEDMNTVVGEMDKQQSNDFSKIQARFANRMKLTSADVAEVIQKRLLMKNDHGIYLLSKVYHEQANNFKTLFDFADGSQTYRNFNGRDHFILSYPFIPYQFTLFQSAITNLSAHNAFEGKHRSVGERSMLGVFQEVAVQISDHEMGQLATFDLMFEGIRTALKAQIQRSILVAEKNLDNRFAVQVLKALFLVKYIKEFKATFRNMTVLMLNGFDRDVESLTFNLKEALDLLEHETYIQRNGDLYEFLTDEEKDIEEEIKNTEADSSKVAEELSKIVFDHVIKHKKIRYDESGQDYPFSRKMDDRLFGREHELKVHIITSFHENADNEQILCMQSMGRDELLVIMPPDKRMMDDLLMYERTKKYIRQNISSTQHETAKRILSEKAANNEERLRDLRMSVKVLLGRANLYINGSKLELNGEDARTRVTRGFYELIVRSYPNLKMLLGFTYTEGYVSKCLKQGGDTLLGNDVTLLSEAEQEMLSTIKSNKNAGVRTTVKSLIERFERKSYGWYYAAILSILAKLCAAGKVEISSNGNLLEEEQLEKSLLNSKEHPQMVMEPLIDFTPGQIRSLKEFYEDFFDAPPTAGEAKALGKETITAFKNLIEQLSFLTAEKSRYPFLLVLDRTIETLKRFQEKPYQYFLKELQKDEDDLLDLKENVIGPVKNFMGGTPKEIYGSARKFVRAHATNFAYIKGDEARQIQALLIDPACYKGNCMQKLKSMVDSLKQTMDGQILSEITKAKGTIFELQTRLQNMDEFSILPPVRKKQLNESFDSVAQALDCQTLIAVIRDTSRRFEEGEYQGLLSKMSAWAKPVPPKPIDSGTPSNNTKKNTISESKVEYVATQAIHISFDKAWLADEKDIDRYLSSLREAMVKEISDGKRISI